MELIHIDTHAIKIALLSCYLHISLLSFNNKVQDLKKQGREGELD